MSDAEASEIAVVEPSAKIVALSMAGGWLKVGDDRANRGQITSIQSFGTSSFIVRFSLTPKVYIVPTRAVDIIELEIPNVDK